MNNRFRVLAEMFSEMRYFDLKEVESLIEIHFKSWYNDEFKSELLESDIVKKRTALQNERNELQLNKNVIECQLLIAKSELREGKKVDTAWMARANLASKIVGSKMLNIQAKLINLRAAETANNIERANSQDRQLNRMYFEYLKELHGEDEAKKIQKHLELKGGINKK